MACWKARVEFLLSVIELLFLSLTVEALQGKMCQNSLSSGGGRSLAAKISGGRGRPILTKYRRVTDGRTDGRTDRQTDGIAVASTALAMRSLRRAVKIGHIIPTMPISGWFLTVKLILALAYLSTRLEDSSFTHSEDGSQTPNLKLCVT